MKKNEKRIISSSVDFYLDWTYGVAISKIRKDLDALEALGATRVDIGLDTGYGDPSISIEAFSERLETDGEFRLRMEKIAMNYELIEKRELAELNRLKAKYNL